MFGLSKSNINSYENGALPKLDVFIQIMEDFELDASKFVLLDMTKHSVGKDATVSNDDKKAEMRSKELDRWIASETPEKVQQDYLSTLSMEEIRAIHIKQQQVKQELLKENLELKDENKMLKDRYIALLEQQKRNDQGS